MPDDALFQLPETRRLRGAAALALVADGQTSAAVRGAVEDADFEIGSISKGITGLLYVDAVERGEVTPNTPLRALLPLGGSPVGELTLHTLSTHRSGLPRLPAAMQPWRRTWALLRHGSNPYGETVPELLQQVRDVRPGRARARYSNLGFELLGHAVASAAGSTYVELVRRRVAEPLGLDAFYVPTGPGALSDRALRGVDRFGRPREPWTGEALAPAGGIRASIHSMAGLLEALLDGSAPGVAALDPVERFTSGLRIGAGWLTVQRRGSAITWHNGGTGGFRSWVGLDRDAGHGVVVLSARAATVDRIGFALLRRAGEG